MNQAFFDTLRSYQKSAKSNKHWQDIVQTPKAQLFNLALHSGSEQICTLNDLRVHGKSAAEDLEDRLSLDPAEEEADTPLIAAPAGLDPPILITPEASTPPPAQPKQLDPVESPQVRRHYHKLTCLASLRASPCHSGQSGTFVFGNICASAFLVICAACKGPLFSCCHCLYPVNAALYVRRVWGHAGPRQ